MARSWFQAAAIVTALPLLAWGQTNTTGVGCGPSEEVRQAIREVASVQEIIDGKSRTREEVRKEREEREEDLLRRFPDNFWVLRRQIVRSQDRAGASRPVVDRMKARYEARPDDVEAAYLYAHALIGTATPEAIPLLDLVVSRNPEFFPAWNSRVTIFSSPAFRDDAKLKVAATRVVELCPDSLEAIVASRHVLDSVLASRVAKAVRSRIEGQTDRESLNSWVHLWNLEFRLASPAEHAPLREQVKRDLAFLKSPERERTPALSFILGEGAKLAGDKEAEELAKAERAKLSPSMTFFEASNEWHKKNMASSLGDRQAWAKARLQFLEEWLAKIPDEERIWVDLLTTLDQIDDTPAERLKDAGEKALQAAENRRGDSWSIPGTKIQVANVWVKRGIELPRALELALQGRAEQEKVVGRMDATSDLFRMPGRELSQESSRWMQKTMEWRTLSVAYAKLEKPEAARAELSTWESALAPRRERVAAIRKEREAKGQPVTAAQGASPRQQGSNVKMFEDMMVRSLPMDESDLATARGEVALALGRKQDALQHWIAAARLSPASNWQTTAVGNKLKKLWSELGGTQEGWQALIETVRAMPSDPTSIPKRERFVEFSRALPEDLKLNDLQGKTWTLANLKGKTTLINVWATWCGPCREELPHLQKVHDKLKDREDVQVITLNIDDSAGVVEPYMKENKFTFPVLFARSFLDSFVGPLGIPTNWFADRTATLKIESVGFGGFADWEKEMLEKLESLRAK